MQSAVVYSRTAARSIASNISNECSSKCSTSVSKHSTITTKTNILSDRLLNRFYSNLRYLSQGLSILTKSSSNIHSSTFLTSPMDYTSQVSLGLNLLTIPPDCTIGGSSLLFELVHNNHFV